jgi:hypothetical protein
LVVVGHKESFTITIMVRRRGLTFLELLLATSLATLLMLLVLTVAAGLRHTQVRLQKEHGGESIAARLKELMEQDTAMADEIGTGANQLTLTGFSRLGRYTLAPHHGPTRVSYRLVSANGRGYLLRQQTELDNQTNQESQTEILLAGISEFTVESVQTSMAAAATQPSTQPARASMLRVTVVSDDPSGAAIPEFRLLLD